MDILLNRWLLYQALACRVWDALAFINPVARSAFVISYRIDGSGAHAPDIGVRTCLNARVTSSSQAMCCTGGTTVRSRHPNALF